MPGNMQADEPLRSPKQRSCQAEPVASLLLATCETGRAVRGRAGATDRTRSPDFPRKEEPMFAGLELTPTATRWDSATSPTEGRAQPNREAEAVMGLQSPAATPSRSTFVTRLLAGLDEPRPRPHRPELVVSCMWQIVATPPHGRGRRPTPCTLATSTVPLLLQPRGRRPARTGFFSGLSRRPARPIELAVVATMRTGSEVGPRVGRQARMYRRRRRWAEASRRSSPPLSLCAGAHDRPR